MKMFLVITTLLMSLFCLKAVALGGAMAGGELHIAEYTYDFAKDGGAVGAIDLSKKFPLPSGAVIESAHYMVMTALTSSGSATVALGDAASGARYLAATAYNNAAFDADVPKVVAIGVPVKVSSANLGKPALTIGTAALTAGKLKIWMKVYVPKQ